MTGQQKLKKKTNNFEKGGDNWIKSMMNLAKNVVGLNQLELITTVKPSHRAKWKSVELVSAQ